jgi:malate dehydrogenase (oxaloacetate-decarboxylating)(NADP+)
MHQGNSNINTGKKVTDEEALEYHKYGTPGKISILPTKPLVTQRDLSLAYSPGVAAPCLAIKNNPASAYDYTAKGNMVAVISNGTAVLGLGNLGSLAAKPVMEGKCVLLKRFAGIDAIDIEVDTENINEFINCVRFLGNSWGGINLEDIKSPDCFVIETELKKKMNIPVFHDDQHGTAIIILAGLINASHIAEKKFEDLKIVLNGPGAAGIACLNILKQYGIKHENLIACDRDGVIYKGRSDQSMNPWKLEHAVQTEKRTLKEALIGADVFIGLSVKDVLDDEMLRSMSHSPIIFALANPDPEVQPEHAKKIRPDAIIATGRSDYPNQVNNVMGFPYIFRGALDVRAKEINDTMKIAAAESIAALAREPVPQDVAALYSDTKLEYGPNYIIPVPFDQRLITRVSIAVAKAAMASNVATLAIDDFDDYKKQLEARLDPTYNSMTSIFNKVKATPKRVIFSEGEEDSVIRAAIYWRDNGFGTPILVGRHKNIMDMTMSISKNENLDGIEIWNAANVSEAKIEEYVQYFYNKNFRKGYLYRDCVRLVKNARNIFASCMLASGDGDALVSGMTRGYHTTLSEINQVIDVKNHSTSLGIAILISHSRNIFIADAAINENPSAKELADIACQAAEVVAAIGYKPRVALISFSNFGNMQSTNLEKMQDALKELQLRNVNFEFEGEMSPEVALNENLLKLYPFARLSGPANILVMPDLASASIASKLIDEMGGGILVGPILCGLEKPVQIVHMGSSVSDIINSAAFAAAQN